MRQHRDQQLDRTVGRRAQDGAQLRQEYLRLGQAVANRTQAERGIERGLFGDIERLVGADVERANRHRAAFHRHDRATIRLELLILGR